MKHRTFLYIVLILAGVWLVGATPSDWPTRWQTKESGLELLAEQFIGVSELSTIFINRELTSVFAGRVDGTIHILRVTRSGEALTDRLQTKLTSIEQILHSEKEDVIAVLGSQEIELWNLTKRTKIRSLVGPLGYYQKIALSPDQRTLAASANRLPAQGQIAIWNIAEGGLLKTFENPNGKLKIAGPLLFTSNGTKLLVGAQGGVIVMDAVSGKLDREIVAPDQGEIHSMALSPDGRSLAVSYSRSPSGSSISSEISVLDLVTYRQSALLSGVATFPNSLIYSPDGSQFLAGSGTVGSKGHLQIWRTTDWRKWFDDVIHVDRILSLQYSVASTTLVSVDGSGFIKYWRLKSLQ